MTLTSEFAACVLIGIGAAVLYRHHIPYFASRRHKKLMKRFLAKGAHTTGSQISQKQEQNGKGKTILSTEYSFSWEGQTYRKVVKTPVGLPVPSERMFFFEPSCPAAAICQDVPDLRGYGGYGILLGVLGFFIPFLAFLGFQHQFDQVFPQVTPLLEEVASQPRIGAFSLALLLLFVGNMELISWHFERLERQRKKAIRMGHVIKGNLVLEFFI